jgi:hypothetical protein
MNGYRPVVISMGTNAISHNWSGLHLLHKELRHAYGDIDMWTRITFSEGRDGRDDTSRIMYPKNISGDFMGSHNSTDTVENETGTVDNKGVEVLKVRLGVYHTRNKLLSSSYLDHERIILLNRTK